MSAKIAPRDSGNVEAYQNDDVKHRAIFVCSCPSLPTHEVADMVMPRFG